MLNKITPRIWYLFVVISCVSMLGYAYYLQHVEYLDPCPLCILQRVVFMWIGFSALVAVIHNPARTGQRVYGWLVGLGAVLGASIAGRHVWLQSLPPGDVPECGPGLNYMLDNFPLSEILSTVFYGSGSCAEVKWQFLGLSMPLWALVWYIGLGLVTFWILYRPAKH